MMVDEPILDAVIREIAKYEAGDKLTPEAVLRGWMRDLEQLRRFQPLIVVTYREAMARKTGRAGGLFRRRK